MNIIGKERYQNKESSFIKNITEEELYTTYQEFMINPMELIEKKIKSKSIF